MRTVIHWDVMMAMSSAAFGAEAVEAWLDDRKRGERLLRNYEQAAAQSKHLLVTDRLKINTPVLRDMFTASIDLFNIGNGLVTILTGDFYETP
jgi:hypothetical protein